MTLENRGGGVVAALSQQQHRGYPYVSRGPRPAM